ncbi:cytochrome c [Helicobacter sp. MIT 11-5569]|uniref:c-type cytochrome n=1 Tax=Helicobacter sp. MIT 11-5569 TaxID=1548151 RepID=UPI00051FA50F|nr:cytochrome c [Helicobacter sp. MIT 11-5569]TLD81415.1 cytochrome c [Helicobacter sp. MIT 11-5569]
MKKQIIALCALTLLGFSVANADSKEWLPKGEGVGVFEYVPNSPKSPAAYSTISTKTLTNSQKKGQQIYSKWCMPCHGVGMPGTNALEVTYQGLGVPALLEDRTDLSADLVSTFVRYGKHSMPFFRKTEISDEELKFLGDYLSRNVK